MVPSAAPSRSSASACPGLADGSWVRPRTPSPRARTARERSALTTRSRTFTGLMPGSQRIERGRLNKDIHLLAYVHRQRSLVETVDDLENAGVDPFGTLAGKRHLRDDIGLYPH